MGGRFSKFVEIQKKILQERELEAPSPYFDAWDILITVGPASVEVSYNFINLFENEFKPNIDKEQEKIEAIRFLYKIYKYDHTSKMVL